MVFAASQCRAQQDFYPPRQPRQDCRVAPAAGPRGQLVHLAPVHRACPDETGGAATGREPPFPAPARAGEVGVSKIVDSAHDGPGKCSEGCRGGRGGSSGAIHLRGSRL
eukprot:754803-Hanusia_phi.AAC.3